MKREYYSLLKAAQAVTQPATATPPPTSQAIPPQAVPPQTTTQQTGPIDLILNRAKQGIAQLNNILGQLATFKLNRKDKKQVDKARTLLEQLQQLFGQLPASIMGQPVTPSASGSRHLLKESQTLPPGMTPEQVWTWYNQQSAGASYPHSQLQQQLQQQQFQPTMQLMNLANQSIVQIQRAVGDVNTLSTLPAFAKEAPQLSDFVSRSGKIIQQIRAILLGNV